MTDTLTSEQVDLRTSHGDHERFAHYVWGRDPGTKILESSLTGVPITALCGKRWVPQRDPRKFPVCPECLRIKKELQAGGNNE